MTETKQYSLAALATLGINAAAIALKFGVSMKQNPQTDAKTLFTFCFTESCVSSALSVLGSQLLKNSGTDKSITDYVVNVVTSVVSSGLPYIPEVGTLYWHGRDIKEFCISIAPLVAINFVGAFLTNVAVDYFIENDLKDSEVDGEYGYI